MFVHTQPNALAEIKNPADGFKSRLHAAEEWNGEQEAG